MQIRSLEVFAALSLVCAGSALPASSRAQPAQQAPIDDFDLGAPPPDAEALLVTNAGRRAREVEACIPSDDPARIVVCARDPMQYRIDSSLDEATRKGEAAPDGLARAPEFAPSCRTTGETCIRVGPTPYRPILIDLDAIPESLPPQTAEKVRFALTPEEMAAARRAAGLDAPAPVAAAEPAPGP